MDGGARSHRRGCSPVARGAGIRFGYEFVRNRNARAWIFLEHAWVAICEPRSRRLDPSEIRFQSVAFVCARQSHYAECARICSWLGVEQGRKTRGLRRTRGTDALSGRKVNVEWRTEQRAS